MSLSSTYVPHCLEVKSSPWIALSPRRVQTGLIAPLAANTSSSGTDLSWGATTCDWRCGRDSRVCWSGSISSLIWSLLIFRLLVNMKMGRPKQKTEQTNRIRSTCGDKSKRFTYLVPQECISTVVENSLTHCRNGHWWFHKTSAWDTQKHTFAHWVVAKTAC